MKYLTNKLAQFKLCILSIVICSFGFHNWEISKWCRFKDKKCKYLDEEGFDRKCQWCGKEQRLMNPKKYHPSKYVWTDISNNT